MTYKEAIEYIHSIGWRGSKPGLSRIRELLSKLGNPQDDLKFIHVAGTNGKGSTCAMIESILRMAGYRTGLFISPYVYCFNERIQVDGQQIADDELAELMDVVKPIAEEMADPPTQFELITAVGMLYYRKKQCDIVVLEVGLGGELDSTNIIKTPEVAVITSIGLDHTAILGTSILDIAKAKAGIMKEGGSVAICGRNREAMLVFKMKAEKVGANIYRPRYDSIEFKTRTDEKQVFSYASYDDLELPLAGTYQLDNAALAITVAQILQEKGWNISEEAVRKGLANVKWPGRFDIIHREPTVIIDGSHNPQAIRATTETLRAVYGKKKIIFVTGVFADKDYRTMMTELTMLAKSIVATQPVGERGLDAETLAHTVEFMGRRMPVKVEPSIADACAYAWGIADKDDVICVIGSFSLIAPAREAFEKLFEGKAGRKG
jgi:dihydrofolate synthase/folylpolyglutamate synthase